MSDLEEWLRAAGFHELNVTLDGTLAAFQARRRAGQSPSSQC